MHAIKKVELIIRAKKQLRAASLCHSLVPHTNEELSLRFKLIGHSLCLPGTVAPPFLIKKITTVFWTE